MTLSERNTSIRNYESILGKIREYDERDELKIKNAIKDGRHIEQQVFSGCFYARTELASYLRDLIHGVVNTYNEQEIIDL